MKILVIDDNTRLLAEVTSILTRNGHSVECSDSANKALTMVGSTHYDFVLVDYRMPEHDGFWFLKNASLPRNTKALLVTSYIDRSIIKQMFNAGISGYIMKPFDEEELLSHLKFHSTNHLTQHDIDRKEVSA